ncbi:AGE family epimerase/isomerase [Gelidibacter maritimus]|uniref:AGE family epimerase/isomerase n=1 Tax=Gelidibacter maritimus TaxID=2761487 RepID=A0A7W2M5K4_9FLAO|nr:AGE family epimerase/isomerase [Gelidibacter maritimus]MBA6153109.1 AGE family epimerase/isomerase [Gelidibacter maritimus]
MLKEDFTRYKKLYRENLFDNVIPFWMTHSLDKRNGGYYSCLKTNGDVYDTEKLIWLQCRQVWTFAKFYNEIERNTEWLNIAKHGADFLEKHGRDKAGNWYFSLQEKGAPLIQPYNIFSDCFAAMAFSQLSKALNNENYTRIAKQTFENILLRQSNPKGTYNKSYPGTRELKNLALPMILSNLVQELSHILDETTVKDQLTSVKDLIINQFYNADKGIIVENVGPNGEFVDSFAGRLVNPGHGLETLWFLMDVGEKLKDPKLIEKCANIVISTLEYSWDKDHGGIFYFMDLKGNPPEQLEWDQKLWWPHIEAMIACLKGFYHTQNPELWQWFVKLHDYTWGKFVDEEHGEWFGYLSREGKVTHDLKGGKWKGCFHVPRGLFNLWQLMDKLEKMQEKKVPIAQL